VAHVPHTHHPLLQVQPAQPLSVPQPVLMDHGQLLLTHTHRVHQGVVLRVPVVLRLMGERVARIHQGLSPHLQVVLPPPPQPVQTVHGLHHRIRTHRVLLTTVHVPLLTAQSLPTVVHGTDTQSHLLVVVHHVLQRILL